MMRPRLRAPLALAAVVMGAGLLSACNVVMTKEPLFTQADAAGAPPLRPGVWLFFKDPDCKFDERAPFTDWPDCAGGALVTSSDIVGRQSGAAKGVMEHSPLVLAAGDPRVAQLQVTVDVSGGASAEASGDASASASVSAPAHSKPYGYAAIHPTKFDDQGRIVAFTSWPVQCGPPPPNDKDGNPVAAATLKPLPGIEMKPGDAVCTTHSKDALHAAAKASEPWADQVRESRWLRDADR